MTGVNGNKMESGGFNQTGSSSNGTTRDLSERRSRCYLEVKAAVFRTPPIIHRRILNFSSNMNDDQKEMDLPR